MYDDSRILRLGFFVIATCTVLDCLLFLALGCRYANSVLFPVHPANLETASTYINFDLLYRNGTKTSFLFPPIRALPRALAQVLLENPTGSTRNGPRRSLRRMAESHRMIDVCSSTLRSRHTFSSAYWTTGWRTAASRYESLSMALTVRWKSSASGLRSMFGASL